MIVDPELLERLIAPDARPADARLAESAYSVWSIIAYARAVGWDFEKVAEAYDLSTEEFAAALAYYELHREVIDAKITLNAA